MAEMPRRRRLALPFSRRLAISLVTVAVVPLLVFGVFSVNRIDAALGSDADSRIAGALDAVDSVLAGRERELAETTSAYATWSVTGTLIDAGSTDSIQKDILGFLVERGTVDLAIAIVGSDPISAGPSGPVAGVITAIGRPDGPSQAIIAADGDLYEVSVAEIPGPSTSGGDWMVFGRRLDAAFTLEIHRLTGFDVAVLTPAGRISVATDPAAIDAVVRDLAGPTDTIRRDGIDAGWKTIGSVGDPIGRLVVTSRQASAQSLLSQLPAVLLVSLMVGTVLAVVAAWALGRGLNLRLTTIYDSLTAMTAGRRPSPLAIPDEPDVRRLAIAVEGLVQATDRRERILADVSAAIAAIRPEQGIETVAQAAADIGRSIFGLDRCSLIRTDASVSATSPIPENAIDRFARTVEAPVEMASDDYDVLVGSMPSEAPWTEADTALFELYARLVGASLRDALVHDDASDQMDRLGRRNDLQREFLRSVSHNLQTPLTTISLIADDLADLSASTEPSFVSRRVAAIRIETDRLERLVAQLLTITRLDAGQTRLERDAVALTPVVRSVWAELGVERTFEVDDSAEGLIAIGDRSAIAQVLWILLENAIRYAPGSPIRIRTLAADPASAGLHIAIEIEDEGPGIPLSERGRIFQRFWSGRAGRQQGGTGIGLDIARRLAHAMEGTLEYRPAKTTGSVFVLTLPAEHTQEV